MTLIETYKKLRFLASGKFVDAELTVSKTIEALATRAAKYICPDIKMEKLTPVRKIICYECKSQWLFTQIFLKLKQCKVCDSEGELLSDGKTHMKN